jgi:hypothetical protein
MQLISARHRLRLRIPATLFLALVCLLLLTPAAFAVGASCRADPIVSLSNGDQLAITAAVGADVSAISSITYTVHAPKGVSMTKVVYTQGPTAPKETVIFSADRTSGYSIDTYVTTLQPGMSVTASVLRTTLASGITYSGQVSGWSGQHLVLTFK